MTPWWNQQLPARIFLDALRAPPEQILAPVPRKMLLDVPAAGGQSLEDQLQVDLESGLDLPSEVISIPLQFLYELYI